MNYMIGVEREGLRIDNEGMLADTPHPCEFGDRLANPLIGTDFGEAMLELRTCPQPDPDACYKELMDVTRRALRILYDRGEYLWPYSIPWKLPEDAEFHYNSYPDRKDLEEYERVLTQVFGIRWNCISGIHVHFSLSNDTFDRIKRLYPSVPDDKDEAYIRCARQVIKRERALRHFFGGSPTDFDGKMIPEDSFRNTSKEFHHKNVTILDYSNKTSYLQSLRQTKNYDRRSPVRIRGKGKEGFDEGIGLHGVDQLEFRLSDIDPFDLCGISQYELELTVAILFMSLVKDEDDIPDDPSGILIGCAEVNRNLQIGLDKGINYYMNQEKTGMKKSDRIRIFLEESGFDGLLKLALEYGVKCGTKRNMPHGRTYYHRGDCGKSTGENSRHICQSR